MIEIDVKLATRCAAGDRAAFETIIEKYEKPVFNLAYRMVGCPDDAMDVTQTVFSKAFGGIHGFNPEYRLFSWLYKIAINESLNLLKQRKRNRNIDVQGHVAPPTPEEEYFQGELEENLHRALAGTSHDLRITLILKYFLQLSYHQIGEILGIPQKTVKSRLFTGRQALRDLLIEQGYRS